jgi:hypothetical protein
MKNHPLTTPKLLLLCLTAIGSSAALAQQLGAIPVAVAANPAFIQAGPSGMAAQAIQTATQAVTATPVASTAPTATSPANTPAKQAAQTDEKANEKTNDRAKPVLANNAQPTEKAAPDATPPKAEVNPMTGKVADIETLTLTYEREKLLAAIATEKQKRLTAERTANDQAMPTPPSGPMKAPLVGPVGSNPGAPANAPVETPVKPVKVAKTKPVQVMPAMPMLAGTMMQNGERYAIIEQSGESVVVKQGQTAFGQAVGRISESSVSLGGMMLSAQAPSVMRVARNDMPVGGASVGGTQSVAGNGPMPAPLSGVNPSLPLTIPTQGQAPTNTAMMQPMGIPATGAGIGR